MFDIEYGDRIADAARRAETTLSVKKQLTSAQLVQLCECARTAALTSYTSWFNDEREKLSALIQRRGSSAIRRAAAWMTGQPYSSSESEARKLAEAEIASYEWMLTNWEARGALRLAEKWLGAARNVTSLDAFELSSDEYSELLRWAARATSA